MFSAFGVLDSERSLIALAMREAQMERASG
jgi:hypothetical protein